MVSSWTVDRGDMRTKYVVLLRHMAMGILVERLWTSACARVARTLDVYDCELSWWVLMSTGATGSRTCGPDTRSRVAEANEGLADVDARLFDPDPKIKYLSLIHI